MWWIFTHGKSGGSKDPLDPVLPRSMIGAYANLSNGAISNDLASTLKRTVEKTSTLVANMSTVNVLFWLAYTTVDFVLQKMLNYNATLAVNVCLHLCGV